MKSLLSVNVLDYKHQPLTKAKVEIEDNEKKVLEPVYNELTGLFELKNIPAGIYSLKASNAEFQSQARSITVQSGENKEVVLLGKKAMPYYYKGQVKVPFEAQPKLLAVSLKGKERKQNEQKLQGLVKELGLKPVEVSKAVAADNTLLLELAGEMKPEELQAVINRLHSLEFVKHAGQLVNVDKETVSFLSDEIVVKFKANISQKEAEAIIKRLKGEKVRTIPYIGNGYLLKYQGNATYDILAICEKYVATGKVDYAEPNLINTLQDLAVNPTDFLYANQWHIPIVQLPDAWQELRNIDMPLTFGAPTTLLAVFDRGIQSTTTGGVTSAAHPDFAGTLTNGASKVSNYFDFDDMVANNDTCPNDHGMGCSGVSGARANNASTIAGENEGVVGAAPNCQLMGVIRPAGGTETDYADAYIWMAGFNAGSTTPGFPAQLARGADIISNSFSWSPWPLSGTINDMINFLVTYGRGGKGVLLFIASGNGNSSFSTQQGMATHPKTFAIAASSLADDGTTEVRAGYSNFGDANGQIDVCAPSHDNYVGGNIVHNPPANYGVISCDLLNGGNVAGHTGGGMDYTNTFGGTSSATPLSAGVGALLLSVNPYLTWIEVRQILRNTAAKIDAANTNATGRWTDVNGLNSGDPGYAGPFYSRWYGYGRIDAEAAVIGARDYDFSRDLIIRDNTLDNGLFPSTGNFWNGVDIWVRNVNDGTSPATYAAHADTVHQAPIAGQVNYLNIRFKNRGSSASFPFYVRAYITHWPGAEFTYPASFIPSVNPGDPIPSPLTPGTYLIGEVLVNTVASGANDFVTIPWPANLIPPATVSVSGMDVQWHPCVLAEVSPHDGFIPPGNHIWENNNLAQKNLSITYPGDGSGDSNVLAGVLGGEELKTKFRGFELNIKWPTPRTFKLYIQFLNRYLETYIREQIKAGKLKDFTEERVNDKAVFYIAQKKLVKFTLPNTGLFPFMMGTTAKKLPKGDSLNVDIAQYNDSGKLTGGLTFSFRGK